MVTFEIGFKIFVANLQLDTHPTMRHDSHNICDSCRCYLVGIKNEDRKKTVIVSRI